MKEKNVEIHHQAEKLVVNHNYGEEKPAMEPHKNMTNILLGANVIILIVVVLFQVVTLWYYRSVETNTENRINESATEIIRALTNERKS